MIFSSSPPQMKMLEGPALSGPRSRQSATLHQDTHFHESRLSASMERGL